MSKIRNKEAYPLKKPTDDDFVIGSDSETSNKKTRNFSFKKIKEYLIEVGFVFIDPSMQQRTYNDNYNDNYS